MSPLRFASSLPARQQIRLGAALPTGLGGTKLRRLDDEPERKPREQHGQHTRIPARQGLNPITVLSDKDNARKLVDGQIDLWATGDPAGRYLARQEGVSGLKTVLRFNQAELFLALNKETPDAVVAKLQKALDDMRAEGLVDKIQGNYL